MRIVLWLLLALIALTGRALAGEVSVAVAANFRAPLAVLGDAFARETGHVIRVSAGSTGQLYAQIVHGAPFDVFLAADQARPLALVKAGLAIADSRTTYAEGQLYLITSGSDYSTISEVLAHVTRLSIANPKTAPYGAAAMQVLEKLSIAKPRIAYAQSVSGVNAALRAGAVDAGFSAYSSVIEQPAPGVLVDRALHDPIRQDGVLLARASDNEAARAFIDWLGSPEAAEIIRRFGYHVD